MKLRETLTKENFWNKTMELYPKSTKLFCDWIDEYKKAVNWTDLFPVKQRKHYWAAIKFHHLPYAMQQGIWIEFVTQHLEAFFEQPEYSYSGDLEDDIIIVFMEIEEIIY